MTASLAQIGVPGGASGFGPVGAPPTSLGGAVAHVVVGALLLAAIFALAIWWHRRED